MGMKGNNGFWKWLAAVVVLFLLLNPETIQLAVFIDAIGIEMLLNLLQVQLTVLFFTWFRLYLAPVISYAQKLIFSPFVPSVSLLK